jgi:trk system potassium uptake protein TrkA
MKIIILGANQVGGALAEELVKEGHALTVVDSELARLQALEKQLDLRTLVGHPSHPSILRQAGIETADMLIAVTHIDEVNIVACQVAYDLYRIPKKIACIRAPEYLAYQNELFNNENLAIDFCISPEQLVTNFVAKLIEYPGALQVLEFAEGRVLMLAINPQPEGLLVGKSISQLKEYLPVGEIRVVAIYRDGASLPLKGDTRIEIRDEIFFISEPAHIQAALNAFGRLTERNHRIMIAGGGNIGYRLAQALEGNYQVKILEQDLARATYIAEQLSNTTVLHATASDQELLLNENIANTDVFCALTNEDETNIMASLQAKRLGAHQVMSLISRAAYVDLIQGGGIDVAISPKQATISGILRYLRKGDVTNAYSLRRGAAEAIEIIVHGDERSSRVVNKTIEEIILPRGANIGAVIRGDEVMMAHHDTLIKSGDKVLVFVLEKESVSAIERLFRSTF